MSSLKECSRTSCFGGSVVVFEHASSTLSCDMKFSAFFPPQCAAEKCPVLLWLSGLTCTEQNFITKAGAQRVAAELGIVLVCPDTSPRGCNIEGEDTDWDFGTGAGFYLTATQEPWAAHYDMFSYVCCELLDLVQAMPGVDISRVSISGHSMGGHGALVCALKNPGKFKSCSAFAPICNPTACPWGEKAFSGYLGEDRETWKQWDASLLSRTYSGPALAVLVDQGTADTFLDKKQLLPEALSEAAATNDSVAVELRMQPGYDHSYYFIATFIEDHLRFHSKYL
eukprot:TRINITY_DN4938_c0_g1_i1.p1 TRINITY_DN4938_c0_g1~~TRINITY_DN4938_c0_g1_i1.p1  ORF type:complete len:283 (+),score=79.85 TRINITY_DN4938_c0_g1_i1:106-954(+)